MKSKLCLTTFLTAVLLSIGLIFITNYHAIYKKDRHIELMIKNPGENSSCEIQELLYNKSSIPLTAISVSDGWIRDDSSLYSDGNTTALAYLSFDGQGLIQLVFASNNNAGNIEIFIDGIFSEIINLNSQNTNAYTWNYWIEPVKSFSGLILLFFIHLFLLLILSLLILSQRQKDNYCIILSKKKSYIRMWRINIATSVLYIVAAISRRIDATFLYNTIDYLEISIIMLMLIFIINHILWICSSQLNQKMSERIQKIYTCILLLLFPIISFSLMQWMLQYPFASINFKDFIANIVWYYLLFGLLYCTFFNLKSAILWGTGIFWFIGAVNFFVYSFRNRPITLNDLYVIQLVADVADNFSFQISDTIYFSAILLGIIWSLSLLLPENYPDFSLRKFFKRLALWAGTFVFFVFSFYRFNYAQFLNMSINWWGAEDTYEEHGFIAAFMAYAQTMKAQVPDGYSRQKAEELLISNPSTKVEMDFAPNIIVIMNESWTDFTNISSIQTNEDYLPFYHSLTENTIKGQMYVSVWGGNTSNTEYEFLTGNSMVFFPYGSIPYQQFIYRATDNLTSFLKEKGYQGTAIHPYNSSGYNRNRVYPLFGFDNMYFIDNFENANYVRWCIDDHSSFEKIIEAFESNIEKGPQFIFNVTMQNHGGYGNYIQNGDLEPCIYPINIDSDSDVSDIIEYLSLIRLTDEALKELITYFSSIKEETVIVMFGDHHPGLSEESKELLFPNNNEGWEEMQKNYQVPFFIWANFDIYEQEHVEISPNYLASYILSTLNMELSPFQEFLIKQYQEIPVINTLGYKGSDHSWYFYGQGPQKYENILKNYEYLQYYRVFDSK